jgi:hypothetical protein
MDVCINFMGEDFIADVDYDVTSYGSPAHLGSLSYPGDPGDPPEFEILSITLRRDIPPVKEDDGFGNQIWVRRQRPAEFEATGALFDSLCESERITDAVYEAIANDGPPDFDDNYF